MSKVILRVVDCSPTQISRNFSGSQLVHQRQSVGPSGGVSITSGNSVPSGTVQSSKTRIRWTQDLHDQFVECVNHLGGADSKQFNLSFYLF